MVNQSINSKEDPNAAKGIAIYVSAITFTYAKRTIQISACSPPAGGNYGWRYEIGSNERNLGHDHFEYVNDQ